MRDFGLETCSKARKRLLQEKVPITSLHSASEARGESVHVAETVRRKGGGLVARLGLTRRTRAPLVQVSRFITAMDALKLDMKAVDDIQPLVNDLCSSLNRHPREAHQSASQAVKDAVKALNEQRSSLSRW